MQDELTPEEAAENKKYEDAKTAFAKAVRDYCEVMEPGTYVADWVLLTHRRSAELEQQGTSALSLSTPTGQSWLVTRGMLHAGMDLERGH